MSIYLPYVKVRCLKANDAKFRPRHHFQYSRETIERIFKYFYCCAWTFKILLSLITKFVSEPFLCLKANNDKLSGSKNSNGCHCLRDNRETIEVYPIHVKYISYLQQIAWVKKRYFFENNHINIDSNWLFNNFLSWLFSVQNL